jgi:hypothetical protein
MVMLPALALAQLPDGDRWFARGSPSRPGEQPALFCEHGGAAVGALLAASC